MILTDEPCSRRWPLVRWLIAAAVVGVADYIALLVTWVLLFTARSFTAAVVICLILALLTGAVAGAGYLLWRSGHAGAAVLVWTGCIVYAVGAVYLLTNPGMVF